jgi:hypothetical protein
MRAVVTAIPSGGGYGIEAIVLMSPSDLTDGVKRVHGFGTIGYAASMEEAVSKWGTVVWEKDGLHIGRFFMARGVIEHDR